MTEESKRLKDPAWKIWGPYLSERQWGTVREDYSADGSSWEATSHELARSKAWRWGEDGMGGMADSKLQLCMAVSLWNERDSILKERYFGLTGNQVRFITVKPFGASPFTQDLGHAHHAFESLVCRFPDDNPHGDIVRDLIGVRFRGNGCRGKRQ